MKSLVILQIVILIVFMSCASSIKNAKSETTHIYGNCGMCKKTIEKAGNISEIALVDWNKETKIASIQYDSIKTNMNKILKRIALAGYDNEFFLAPDEVYTSLPECCQYERKEKSKALNSNQQKEGIQNDSSSSEAIHDSALHEVEKSSTPIVIEKNENKFSVLYGAYFSLKDALTKDNGKLAMDNAKLFNNEISNIPMATLSSAVHIAWMKHYDDLIKASSMMMKSNKLQDQRKNFEIISNHIYAMMKVVKPLSTVYKLHCPMYNNGKGGDWMSKESVIKNPYFGSIMIGCGSVKETIK